MRSAYEIAIVGSGFGGIGMAIRLKRAGFHDLVVLEKADGPGGTWRDNTYPGAACDVPSHLYSFSFEPKTDWTRRFAEQPEILDYLRHCADKYGITPHCRFGTEVTEARFDEDTRLWRISTSRGEFTARVLISACGQLNRPALPDLPGRDSFDGPAFHSARWDHAADLDGRRVAVIGTGASAIQFVPRLAERAAKVHVFQRSAPYVIRKPDRVYTAAGKALLRRLPGWHALSRATLYARFEARAVGFVKRPELMAPMAWGFHRALKTLIADPELREGLVPDYPLGCKRVLLSNDYYPALTGPRVELVTERIERITPRGVRTVDGVEREVDAVVYGTGFRSTEFLAPMKVTGRAGRKLNEAWRDGAHAHLGITVSGFPNLFLLYGPHTNLGHNSIIYMLESQFRYVLGCLRAMRGAGLTWIDVRPEVQDAFRREMRERLRGTVWERGCRSWYMTADGTVVNNWPGFTFSYRNATRRPDPRHFLAGR
ncbi:flavin-containing monooxygenase [Thermomonospora umbrina]|uniref:Cation diffusion facilitator CzcD-associated flavoprotein CzcO n=1 Tax=Thermomonospora umbrina TaxID=111806 RepID=A0A3D9SM67_9ACTN|nr:NAD(P)/FAD-dependent oxidoreductase [Thermomonospora umbrina]REE95013.1 cation diffusion facilitator CzcD-associated flavoprotein CzcO [Thermomonospora umbrina]